MLSKGRAHSFYPRFIHDHARSLVALKRTPEAVALVVRSLAGDDATFALALLYSQLARLPDAGSLPAPWRRELRRSWRAPER